MYSGHISPFLFLIVLLTGCSSTGSDDPVREQPYFLGRIAVGGASGMAVADFNEDDKLDLAVTINEGDTIGIYLNQGRGWLVPAPPLSAQNNPTALATGDFNHDGHLDLVNSNWGSFTVSVFFGDGTGNFGGPTYYGPNSQVGQIEVKDFNNDGHPDFMTSNMGSDNLSLFLNDGQGAFSSNIALTGFSSATKFSSADFNKDGIVDVAVFDRYKVKIFYNNGKGVFGKGRTIYQVNDPMQLKSIDTGDLNSDGIPDVAICVLYSDSLIFAVVFSNNDGSFRPALTYDTTCEFTDVHITDCNGDGYRDCLLIADYCIEPPNKLVTYLGDGQGGLVPGPESVGIICGNTDEIITADMNGDGIDDAIYQDRSSVNTVISFGHGDGTFFSERYLEPIGDRYSSCVTSDLNGDGATEIVAIDTDGGKIVVFRGPDYSERVETTVNSNHKVIRLGDCNGDTYPDAIVGGDFNLGFEVFLGNGDLTFTFHNNPQEGFEDVCRPYDMLLEDFDGNGTLDLITSCGYYGPLSLFSGVGDGHFDKVSDIDLSQTLAMTSGYYDDDSMKDFAVGSGYGTKSVIKIYTGLAGPGPAFQYKSTIHLGGDYGPISMVSKDINRDGTLDLIWTDGEYIFTAAGVVDGTFSPDLIVTRTGPTQWQLRLFDFNGDNLDDIALADINGQVTTMLGAGDGSFYEMVTYYAGVEPDSLVNLDINHDGLDDLFVGSRYFPIILYAAQAGQQTMPALSIIALAAIIILFTLIFIFSRRS